MGDLTPWTPEDLATVKERWLKGDSATMIATAIENRKSRSAIIGIVRRRKWHRPRAISLANSRHVSKSRKAKVSVRPSMAKSAKKKAKPAKPEAPEPKPVVVPTEPITIDQVNDNVCRYPVNDGAPWLYCGAPVSRGSPYCCTHRKLCGNGFGG